MITGRIKKLEDEAKSLRFKFQIVIVILIIIGIANITPFFTNQFSNFQKQLTDNSVTQNNVGDNKIKPVSNGDFQTGINSFFNNTAVSQIGFQLELKKNSISTKGTTNCNTPTPPPIKNGCSFEIRPFATSIPYEGSKLLNILFKGKIGSADKIALNLKDSESGEITANIGNIEGQFKELSQKLPTTFKKTEQILVNLWPQAGSELTVEEVIFEYINYNKLQPVELKLNSENAKKYSGKDVEIYLDVDKNSLLDKTSDTLVSCKENYPGIKPTTVKEDGTVKLERDDSCIKENLPPSWKTDSGSGALSPYYYLGVIKTENSKFVSFPIKVTKDKLNYEIESLN